METDGNIMVTMHVRGVNQNEAIKEVKRKITDLDAMKIQDVYKRQGRIPWEQGRRPEGGRGRGCDSL